MPAQSKPSLLIRFAPYIFGALAAIGAALYARGGRDAVLEARVQSVEEWRNLHERYTADHTVKGVEQGNLIAVFQNEFKHVRERLAGIEEQLRRLADSRTASADTLPPAYAPPGESGPVAHP